MSIILSILLFSSAVFGFVLALIVRAWVSLFIAMAFLVSQIFLFLSPSGLFYHSVALVVSSALTLTILIFISQDRLSSRHKWLSALITIPYVLVCTFKVLQLQGTEELTYGLILSVAAFLYFTLDRRLWDDYWAHLLFISLSSLIILVQ